MTSTTSAAATVNVPPVPERIVRRLENLLKLAGGVESPAQAAAAAGIAAKLMREYDLSLAALRVLRGGGASTAARALGRLIYVCGKNVPSWIKIIISAVTVAQHCQTSIVMVDDEQGKLHHREFWCFGTEADTAMVLRIVTLIVDQVDVMAKFYTGNKHSYRSGIALAVRDRIEIDVAAAEDEVRDRLTRELPPGQGASVMTQALALLDTRRQAARAAQEELGVDPDGAKAANLPVTDERGFADGYLAGQRVKVQVADELGPAKPALSAQPHPENKFAQVENNS